MIKVSNHPLLESEMTIIKELKRQVNMDNPLLLFRDIKSSGDNIMVTCPYHKNGQERHPSAGILTRDIMRSNEPVLAGTFNCQTCKTTKSFEELVSNCFGYDDMGMFGKKWLLETFLTIAVDDRKPIDLCNLSRNVEKTSTDSVSEVELDSYRFTHPYMYERRLNDETIERFDVGYDKSFKLVEDGNEIECITFPVRDKTGKVLFIARRAIDKKMFNYPVGVEKPLYGIYELSQLEEYPNEVYICESIINALTIWSYGKYAVALNGTGNKAQCEQLKQLPVRKYIIALDNDTAGHKGKDRITKALINCKLINYVSVPEGRDINDLEKEEFEKLIKYFC